MPVCRVWSSPVVLVLPLLFVSLGILRSQEPLDFERVAQYDELPFWSFFVSSCDKILLVTEESELISTNLNLTGSELVLDDFNANGAIHSPVMESSQDGTLLFVAARKIFRSFDCGETWEVVFIVHENGSLIKQASFGRDGLFYILTIGSSGRNIYSTLDFDEWTRHDFESSFEISFISANAEGELSVIDEFLRNAGLISSGSLLLGTVPDTSNSERVLSMVQVADSELIVRTDRSMFVSTSGGLYWGELLWELGMNELEFTAPGRVYSYRSFSEGWIVLLIENVLSPVQIAKIEMNTKDVKLLDIEVDKDGYLWIVVYDRSVSDNRYKVLRSEQSLHPTSGIPIRNDLDGGLVPKNLLNVYSCEVFDLLGRRVSTAVEKSDIFSVCTTLPSGQYVLLWKDSAGHVVHTSKLSQ